MVRAELTYNPYLLETDVRFNDDPPRINSLVEKYRGEKLQTWIDKIPSYFHDEMNGFDFDLVFSGPELDFEELKRSFQQAGVGKDRVRLFFGRKLSSRHEKAGEIDRLLEWLDANPNRKFDWASFRGDHEELFEGVYPFVIIGNANVEDRLFDDVDVSVDRVESVDELRKTDLHSTPILLYLDRRSADTLQHSLKVLLSRADVSQDQLFFIIHPELGEKTERVIKDLGVNEPQIVSSAGDVQIHRYLEVFPAAERMHDTIYVLRKQVDSLGEALAEENRQSELANREIHERINILDDVLKRLRTTYDIFTSKEKPGYPAELTATKTRLMYEVDSWRSRKTKIAKFEEAELLSREYESLVARWFEQFRQELMKVYLDKCAELLHNADVSYQNAQYETDYNVGRIAVSFVPAYVAPSFAFKLLEIKVERKAAPKEDFFAGLGMLFNNSANDSEEDSDMETVFFCEDWRTYVGSIVKPIADSMLQEAYISLCDYFGQLRNSYASHLQVCIDDVLDERARVLAQLSEDEKLLQSDNDWHSAFREQLQGIERS